MTALSSNGQDGALRQILEQACTEAKCSANALTVLAVQNDPFRVDTPARHRDGQWLAMHAERLGLGERKIHLRGLHYMLVSGEVAKPDGSPYTNTEEDWTWLVMHAAKAARWLGYIAVQSDHRCSQRRAGRQRARAEVSLPPQPWISVGLDISVPDAVDLEPYVCVDRFQVDQPYRLVFFGEKTSLDDILSPVARDCSADLYLPAGEISDTMLHQMAAAGADGWPADGGLCFSDCDPSGWQMPISHRAEAPGVQGAAVPRARVPSPPGRADARAGPGAWLAINPAEGNRAPRRSVAAGHGRGTDRDRRARRLATCLASPHGPRGDQAVL